jgi:hypothetical protein
MCGTFRSRTLGLNLRVFRDAENVWRFSPNAGPLRGLLGIFLIVLIFVRRFSHVGSVLDCVVGQISH